MAQFKLGRAAALAACGALSLPALATAGTIGDAIPGELDPVTTRVLGENEVAPTGQTGAGDTYEAILSTDISSQGTTVEAGGELLLNVAEAGAPSGDGNVSRTYDRATDTAVSTATATVEGESVEASKTREGNTHYASASVTTGGNTTTYATPEVKVGP